MSADLPIAATQIILEAFEGGERDDPDLLVLRDALNTREDSEIAQVLCTLILPSSVVLGSAFGLTLRRLLLVALAQVQYHIVREELG